MFSVRKLGTFIGAAVLAAVAGMSPAFALGPEDAAGWYSPGNGSGQYGLMLPGDIDPITGTAVDLREVGNPLLAPTPMLEKKDKSNYPIRDRSSKVYVDTLFGTDGLYAVLDGLAEFSDTTIVLRRGSYLPDAGDKIQFGNVFDGGQNATSRVTLRGETEDPWDTYINAKNMTHGIEICNATDIRIAFLSIWNAKKNNIRIHGNDGTDTTLTELGYVYDDYGSANPTQYYIYCCDLSSSREEIVYAKAGTSQGKIEYSIITQYGDMAASGKSVGVKIEYGNGWSIRNTSFVNFFPYWDGTNVPSTNAEGKRSAGVHAMGRSQNVEVQYCSFVNCESAIIFGDKDRGPGKFDNQRGKILNNMIVRENENAWKATPPPPQWTDRADSFGYGAHWGYLFDTEPAVLLIDSPETQVLHNTIYITAGSANAVEARYNDSYGLDIRHNLFNNIAHAIQFKSGATGTDEPNEKAAVADMFVDTLVNEWDGKYYNSCKDYWIRDANGYYTWRPVTNLHLAPVRTGGLPGSPQHIFLGPQLVPPYYSEGGRLGGDELPRWRHMDAWVATPNATALAIAIDKYIAIKDVTRDWDMGVRPNGSENPTAVAWNAAAVAAGLTPAGHLVDMGADEWGVHKPIPDQYLNGDGNDTPRIPMKSTVVTNATSVEGRRTKKMNDADLRAYTKTLVNEENDNGDTQLSMKEIMKLQREYYASNPKSGSSSSSVKMSPTEAQAIKNKVPNPDSGVGLGW